MRVTCRQNGNSYAYGLACGGSHDYRHSRLPWVSRWHGVHGDVHRLGPLGAP